jgi:Na+/H+ antiporter NhaD/arsenite permease-like protein
MVTILILTFIAGYALIVFEHPLGLNKTASALLTGILCWVWIATGSGMATSEVLDHLSHHLSEISEILFFLLGAMTIVEVIDNHYGFQKITSRIQAKNPRVLLWILSWLAFFLSALLDNLTTAIVMTSLVRKMVPEKEWKLYMISLIVLAANAGGAWSPIGDVTTTMLWVGGQITAGHIIPSIFIPSVLNLLIPLMVVTFMLRNKEGSLVEEEDQPILIHGAGWVLAAGLGGLILVPVFKTTTHLPPYMGILMVLGLVWTLTEILHRKKGEQERSRLTPGHALSKIDTPSILFFLGILLAVSALETLHILKNLAQTLDAWTSDKEIIVLLIGLGSAIVDNVPLVAAAIGMYDLQALPQDSPFWTFLAYAAGTGGSILIIGSAAGVAVMGMEKISFMWYAKKISLLAMLGYAAGSAWIMLFS